jgi:hypothetical protein
MSCLFGFVMSVVPAYRRATRVPTAIAVATVWLAAALVLGPSAQALPARVTTRDLSLHSRHGGVVGVAELGPRCPVALPGSCSAGGAGGEPTRRVIWFVRTSDDALGEVSRCALESAARANPDWLVVGLGDGWARGVPPDEPNIVLLPLDLDRLFSAVPVLSHWYRSGVWRSSRHQFADLSDAARLLLMYACGGAYLDDDVISLRALSQIKARGVLFLEREPGPGEDEGDFCNAAMIFADAGRPAVLALIHSFVSTFDTNAWYGWHGPQLLRRAWAQRTELAQAFDTVHIAAPVHFFPLPWTDVSKLFWPVAQLRPGAASARDLWGPDNFAVHLWQSQVKAQLRLIGQHYRDTLVGSLFRDFCPDTFARLEPAAPEPAAGLALAFTQPTSGQQLYGLGDSLDVVLSIRAEQKERLAQVASLCLFLDERRSGFCFHDLAARLALPNPGKGHHIVRAEAQARDGTLLAQAFVSFSVDFGLPT